jgi:hypothetical protein
MKMKEATSSAKRMISGNVLRISINTTDVPKGICSAEAVEVGRTTMCQGRWRMGDQLFHCPSSRAQNLQGFGEARQIGGTLLEKD